MTDIELTRVAKNKRIADYFDKPKYSKALETLDDKGFEDAFQYTVVGKETTKT